MASELTLLVLGWLLGLVSSITAGLVMFWLEGKREIRTEKLKQRREDTRLARNWAKAGKKESLQGFDLAGANLSGKDLSGADLEDTDFEGARMWAANLSGADLSGGDPSPACRQPSASHHTRCVWQCGSHSDCRRRML